MLWQRNVEVRKKVEVKECNLVKPSMINRALLDSNFTLALSYKFIDS